MREKLPNARDARALALASENTSLSFHVPDMFSHSKHDQSKLAVVFVVILVCGEEYLEEA